MRIFYYCNADEKGQDYFGCYVRSLRKGKDGCLHLYPDQLTTQTSIYTQSFKLGTIA